MRGTRHGLAMVWVLVSACGADAGSSPADDSHAPDASKPDVPCTLEAALASHLEESKGVVDCGELEPGDSVEDSSMAQACVLSAAAAGKPFRLIHTMQGVDSDVAEGFAQGTGEARPTIYSYDSDPSGGSGRGAMITRHTCKAIAAYKDCMPTKTFPCLECVKPGDTTLFCDGSK